MAGITHELGVDAVITVFFHIGLVDSSEAERGEVRLGVGSQATGAVAGASPLEINVLSGVVEEKKPGGGVLYSPRWKARFGVGKSSKQTLVLQEPVLGLEDTVAGFGEPGQGMDVERYVTGARSLMGVVADVALVYWDHAMGR
jgi:hypothetical protein